jgi:hypothetical protein
VLKLICKFLGGVVVAATEVSKNLNVEYIFLVLNARTKKNLRSFGQVVLINFVLSVVEFYVISYVCVKIRDLSHCKLAQTQS